MSFRLLSVFNRKEPGVAGRIGNMVVKLTVSVIRRVWMHHVETVDVSLNLDEEKSERGLK